MTTRFLNIFALLAALSISTNGCMSYNAVQEAKGYPENTMPMNFQRDWRNCFEPIKTNPGHTPHPGYYALLPLSVPADTVTSPFQLLDYGIAKWADSVKLVSH